MPPTWVRRAIRRLVQQARDAVPSVEITRGGIPLIALERRRATGGVVGESAQETVVPVRNPQPDTTGTTGEWHPTDYAPDRERVRLQQLRERFVEDLTMRYTNSVTGTVFPMNSMSIDIGRIYPTLVASETSPLPRDMTTSVPLRDRRRPVRVVRNADGSQRVEFPDAPTASSTPTTTPSPPPTIPLAWDDPSIKRARRVVLEDE